MTKHWKAVLGVILIFLFGCFSGAVSTSIYFHHKLIDFLSHPAVALSAAFEKRLTGNLHLDPNQKQQVHQYFQENLLQRRKLQAQIQPQVQTLNRLTVQQIAAILRPDQLELFHQNAEKLRKRLGATASKHDLDSLFAAPAQTASPATNSGAGQPPTQ